MSETRIRWTQGVKSQWYGHIDGMSLRFGLFNIWPWGRNEGPWELSTGLPGYLSVKGDDPGRLKATAEQWLAEFVASLGAVFPEAEPYCNHDAAAVRDGVCECGEVVDPVAQLAARLPRGEWGSDELGTLANWLTEHGHDMSAEDEPDDVACGQADEPTA